MKLRREWLFAATTSFLTIIVASCTNLSAVREWSNTSLEATEYNEIVTTYADTPKRLKRYDPEGPWAAEAARRERQAEALKQILSVVSDYMAALAILSADGTVDYRKDVDELTDSLEELNDGFSEAPIISEDTIDSTGSLVSAVLGAATKAYQARQVTIIVEQANEPLQAILQGDLREIVDLDFRRDLEIERASIDRYYNRPLQTETPSTAATVALAEWKEARLERNLEREKAIDAYLLVLDEVAEGHQKLYENRNDLDSKIFIKELYSLAASLRKRIKVLSTS